MPGASPAANGERCPRSHERRSQPRREHAGRRSKKSPKVSQACQTNDVSISSTQDRGCSTSEVGEREAAKEGCINRPTLVNRSEEPLRAPGSHESGSGRAVFGFARLWSSPCCIW